jgi:cytochrome c5
VREHKSSGLGIGISGLVGTVALIAVVFAVTTAKFPTSRDLGTQEQIAAPRAPDGSVSLAGTEAVISAPATATSDDSRGGAIYNKVCAPCHDSGAAGAPKPGDKTAWEPRMARGTDRLLQTAIDGTGSMPPRGTCLDCSDDDLATVIEYMLVQEENAPCASTAALKSQ